MKTKTYLTSLLSLAIGMMVTGQSNSTNHSSFPENNTDSKKIFATLDVKPSIKSNQAVPTAGETVHSYSASQTSLEHLLKESDDFVYIADNLRTQAKTKTETEKNRLFSEAMYYEKRALYKQVEALEMAGELNLRKFKENKIRIIFLIKNSSTKEPLQEHTRHLIISSEKNMQLAIEMREEAKSLSNPASIAGTMGNAEEKELLALDEQNRAIGQLGKTLTSKM
jgi:hypothetical protein